MAVFYLCDTISKDLNKGGSVPAIELYCGSSEQEDWAMYLSLKSRGIDVEIVEVSKTPSPQGVMRPFIRLPDGSFVSGYDQIRLFRMPTS